MNASRSSQVAFVLWLISLEFIRTRAEDANSGNNGNGGNSQQFSVCSNSAILVEELEVVCDSPGQYYYGGSYYRDSAKCKAKDKAKVVIEFEIGDDVASSPYLTVDVQAYGTVETVRLYDSEYLCDASDLWSLEGQDCPEPGRYMLNPVFYWGAQSDGYSYNFRPRIEMGFSSKQGSNAYDLGGANTNKCSGGSEASWNSGSSEYVENFVESTGGTFFITLTVVVAISGLFYVGARYLSHFPEFRMDRVEARKKKKSVSTLQEISEDGTDYISEEDMKRIAMMRRDRDLIDA